MDRLLSRLPGWELGTCSMKALVCVRCETHRKNAAILVWNGGPKLRCLDGNLDAEWDSIRSCSLAGCQVSCKVLSDPSTHLIVSSSKEETTSQNGEETDSQALHSPITEITLQAALDSTMSWPDTSDDEQSDSPSLPESTFPCLFQPMGWYEPRSSRRIEIEGNKPSAYPLVDFDAPEEEPIQIHPIHPDLIGLGEELLSSHPTPDPIPYQTFELEDKGIAGQDDLIIFDDDSSDSGSDSDSDNESDSGQSNSGGSQTSQSEIDTPPNELDTDPKAEQEPASEAAPEESVPASAESEWIDCDFPFSDSSIPEPIPRFEFPFGIFPIVELEPKPDAKDATTGTQADASSTSADNAPATEVSTPEAMGTGSNLSADQTQASNDMVFDSSQDANTLPGAQLHRESTATSLECTARQPLVKEPVDNEQEARQDGQNAKDETRSPPESGTDSTVKETEPIRNTQDSVPESALPAPSETVAEAEARECPDLLLEETTNPPTEDINDSTETDEKETDTPEANKPEAENPEADKPEPDTPETDKSETENPETENPETDKLETDKPEIDKPETDKPETDKPETDKPETDKPETDKPATDKPETDKPETDKPATDKPETDKPEEGNPKTAEDEPEAEKKDEKGSKKKKNSEKKTKTKEKKRKGKGERKWKTQQLGRNIAQPQPSIEDNALDLLSSPNIWNEEKFEPLCSEPKNNFEIKQGSWKADWEWWEERKEQIQERDDQAKKSKKKGDENAKAEENSDDENEEKKQDDKSPDHGPVPYADGVEELMNMVGIDSVKDMFLDLMSQATVSKSIGRAMNKDMLGAVFTGNPGTGKTTTARLYGQFLASLGLISGKGFEETSGEWIYSCGVKECKRLIDCLVAVGGGVLFIDEAYPMAEHTHCPELNYIISRVEELAGTVVFVFAGYAKEMERFTTRNPGFASRFPLHFKFADFEDAELHQIFVGKLKEKFGESMPVEGGWNGRFTRIAARRIGRGRGRAGFGNAREAQNMVSTVYRRYCRRVFQRIMGEAAESGEWEALPVSKTHQSLTAADLVGPEPSKALMESKAWKSLNAMVGLETVKSGLRSLVIRLQTNYERELAEQPLIASSLHRVFLGNPGTGKTTVAKHYAQILADMGLLTKGEVLLKDPSDFIGEYIGQSEAKTRRILSAAKGNVLVIDEAYMLGPRTDSLKSKVNSYKTAVIDTLVAHVQATGNDDMAVLLLGYREPMQTMLNNVNPGMARRFPLASAIRFEDYSSAELQKILHLRLSEQGLRVSKESEAVALEILERARNKQAFGNAGEIDIMLDRAKDRQQERLAENPDSYKRTLLDPRDLDPDFDRADRAESNVRAMFKDYIGYDTIVERLVGYQNVVRNMKTLGMDPRDNIPFTYLFRGPPGTGKTSTARQIGKAFYDMGFLATDEVVECSASELIGEYCGQTGPKTQGVFSNALGKVLIIDEAYRLNDGKFGVEAVSEMVNLLTKPEYQNKLITVLAGYEDEINQLLDTNPGLTSRFPVSFAFPSLTPEQCFKLLLQELRAKRLSVRQIEASKNVAIQAQSQFSTLTQLPSWGNARDVQTVAKELLTKIMSSADFDPNLEVTGEMLRVELQQMVKEREKRGAVSFGGRGPNNFSYYI